MYLMEKTTLPPTTYLTSFFDNDNHIITLLQSTMTYVLVNSKIVNNKNSTPFSFCYNLLVLALYTNDEIIRFSEKNKHNRYDKFKFLLGVLMFLLDSSKVIYDLYEEYLKIKYFFYFK
jgi:hypothetical protein